MYQYHVKHSHGEAYGSVQAASKDQAQAKVMAMYHNQKFPTTGKVDTTQVVSITIT